MTNRLLTLTLGELKRLNKYHVTTISFIVTIMWFLLLYFIEDSDLLSMFLPFILIIDATMMSVIFVGAIMFFEKTESTFSTMLVTPATNQELILSKAIANTIHQLISSLLIIIVFYYVRQVEVNFIYITFTLVISIFFHSLLGFVFSFHSKDFTTMLVNVMIYSFLFTIPPALHFFNIIFKGKAWDYILLLAPTESAIQLITFSFGGDFNIKVLLSILILLSLTIFGYIFYILPKFKTYAVKQSGV